MNRNCFIIVPLCMMLLLIMGSSSLVQAEISLYEDKFTVTGFLRYEMGLHTAGRNPNNVGQDNFDLTLARAFFQTEWTFKPTSTFKLFSKVRVMHDQTYMWDNNLDTYDAFPVDVASSEWTMMKTDDDNYRAEIWELFADISLGNLWLRTGKQQIVWGEMISSRTLDVINPLDLSWNFMFEPEEFENIRIPTWMIRGIYSVEECISWVQDVTIEGYINPGDVLPNHYADYGAPFNIMAPFPPFFDIKEQDRRGRTEYGVRMGAMLGTVYLTLNYLHVFNDDFLLDYKGLNLNPFALDLQAVYPDIDIYGLTANYYVGGKIDTVVTVESTWVPDQPYGDNRAATPAVTDQGTFNYAVRFDRLTFILPRPTSAMNLTFQVSGVIREGDKNDILGNGNSNVDTNDEILTFQARQPLWHNNLEVSTLYNYDTDGCYMFKPAVKYVRGDHWYFDVYAIMMGGSEDRPGRFGGMDWGDEVVFRVTYQF